DPTTKTITATSIVVDDVKRRVSLVGTVANLASDSSTFTVQGADGSTINISVSATTKVTNLSDGSTATLANGQKVAVSGLYDPLDGIVAATSIVVDDIVVARGTITSIDTTTNTFVLTVQAANVKPTGTTITVATTTSTIIYKRGRLGSFSS